MILECMRCDARILACFPGMELGYHCSCGGFMIEKIWKCGRCDSLDFHESENGICNRCANPGKYCSLCGSKLGYMEFSVCSRFPSCRF